MSDWTATYLSHLRLEQEPPSFSYLRKLIVAHQKRVTLENLDFYYGQRPPLDLKKTFEKILSGRGAIGMHINAMFCELIIKLGYSAELRSVAPYDPVQKEHLHRLWHIGMVVDVQSKSYFVDLGTIKGLSEPVEIVASKPFLSGAQYYQWLTKAYDDHLYLMKSADALSFDEYQRVEKQEVKLIEYLSEHDKYYTDQHAMSQNRWMFRRTETGYLYIENQLFEQMDKGQTEQISITNEQAFWSISSQHFGISQDRVLNPRADE